MKSLSLILTLCCLTATATAAEPISRQPVIELWFVSAQMRPTHPEVVLFDDGSVQALIDAGQVLEGRITPEQLGAIQRELLVDCQLASITTSQLASELQLASETTGLTWRIPNADESVIRCRTVAGERVEVRCPAVGLLSSRFPTIAALQRMRQAQQRLVNVRAIVQVGGGTAASNLAQYATESAQQQSPEVPEMRA
ncbi:MAG: hypothetical protein KDA58_16875, partial [Planctomycetaceae bacterium]|nr:hypothetical protein [Planctomycetaceae bacterium]